jgi:hypothetical protein
MPIPIMIEEEPKPIGNQPPPPPLAFISTRTLQKIRSPKWVL